MFWQTSRRKLTLGRPLVIGILNVTPDSFSDGGAYLSIDQALRMSETMIAGGADIIDVGGESTRPGSRQVTAAEEIQRTAPVIEAIAMRFDIPISVDTTKSEVAERCLDAGAEIVNDISGLRFDERIAEVAATAGAGLILMHSFGTFASMHDRPPVDDILAAVVAGLQEAVDIAVKHGVTLQQIAIDPGIGFGKTPQQNLDLLAKLDKIVAKFKGHALLVGASRKSFLARIVGDDIPPAERVGGSVAAALTAVANGANIVRVHDVEATVQALLVTRVINERRSAE